MMGGGQTLRDIYLPVPANIPLLDAAIEFNASYMRADQGRTSLVLSLDNAAVVARGITLERGDASQIIMVPSTPQPSGFVRFGVAWNTVIPLGIEDSICTDVRSMGNLLRIEPTSRLTYRFDAAAIHDLSMAWTAMPQAPIILVSGKSLAPEAYSTAWRVGLTFERASKRPSVMVMPAVGQVVNTSRLSVPEGLRTISSFAALSQGGQHVLKDAAEVGAWFALSQISVDHIDVVVTDPTLVNSVQAGLSALELQIKAEAPDAVASFKQWRVMRLDFITRPTAAGEIRLALSSGGSTVVVAADAGIKLAEVFDTQWRKVAASTAIVVKVAEVPSGDANAVSLVALGAAPSSFDVIGYGEWIAKFDIGSGLLKGRRPSELVMDLSAAPSTWGTVPVASVFMNEVLLASKQMEATGKRERLTAVIPSSALGAHNVIRVSFVRQLLSDRCRENPGAFPVAVLSSSHMVLGGENSDDDFTGISSFLSKGGDVLVPDAYLADVPLSLARLIRLSAATDVSPSKAKLIVVSGKTKAKPTAPFLAMDIDFPSENRKLTVDKDHLMLADDTDRQLLDIRGLTRVGAASVEHVDGRPGVVYHTVVEDVSRYDRPFQLMNGNFALIGQEGLIAQFDTRSNMDRRLLEEVKEPWFNRYFWWSIPVVVIAMFLALLFAASRYRRRSAK